MNALGYITKLSLNWFLSISFRYEMRANLQGVGAGPTLRGKLDSCTARRGLLNRK